MTGLKTSSCWIATLALLGSLVGCASVNSQSFRAPLIPPAPAAVRSSTAAPEPPSINPRPELSNSPHFFTTSELPARPGRAEAIIREAEWHLQLGRKAYQDGDERGARREFDRAVDLLLSAPDDAATKPAIEKKLDELVDTIHRLDLAGLGSGDFASGPTFEKPPLEDLPELTFPVDPTLKTKVIDELHATASQLPLQVNDAVLSYINYFSTERGRKILISGLRRSGRYSALIRRIFDEEGVPPELIFLAQAESGFLPRAVSRKQATGMWQFMLSRGRQYGLSQSLYADDRLDPEKATRAAARHLRDLYHRYGDWYLAIGAYNCGPGVIDRAVERTGYADFWELRRRTVLPRETANYVPAIVAMTIMVKNPREYGLEGIEADPALEYDTLQITAPTHLQLIADITESPISQIRELNPALLKNIAPAGVSLRVPKGTGVQVAGSIEKVPPERRTSWRVHRIIESESIGAIARQFRVTEGAIATANRDAMNVREPGDLLIIPAAAERLNVSSGRAKSRRHTASRSAAAHRKTASHHRASRSRTVHYAGTRIAARGTSSSIKR